MKFEASQSRQMSQQRQFLSPHPFARRYKTGAVPRPVSLKAAISAQTNAPERAESISGHPAPGTLRLGRTEPCHRLRIPDHIRRKGKALRSRTVRTRPAQASEPQPQQQGAERLRSAIRRMYKRAGADEGIVPLACRKREYARALPSAGRAVASAQASEQHPQQQRTERPCSAIFRARDCFGGGRIRPPASLPHYPPRREGRTPLPLRFGKPDL